jgi:hypothetical protein
MSSPPGSGIKAPPTPPAGVEEAQGRGASPGHEGHEIPESLAFNIKIIPVITYDGVRREVGYEYFRVDEFLEKFEKIVLLNAIVAPPPSLSPVFMLYMNIPSKVAIYLLQRVKQVESYIGHESTALLLTQLSGREIKANRAMYTPGRREPVLVIRLKKRLEKPEDIKNVTLTDLEFAILWYYQR